MTCVQFCGGVIVFVAALLAYLYNDITSNLDYGKQIKFDGSCQLLELPTTAEDVTAFGDGHCAFAGGGDLWGHPKVPGALWFVNATRGTVDKVEIIGDQMPLKIVAHGMHFSQRTRRLYVVNHDEDWQESVEVFQLIEDDSQLRFKHLRSVHSPLFGNFALNDVVEGVDGEFYVTEWQPYPIPLGGKHNPHMTFNEKLDRLKVTLFYIFHIPATRIFRCTLHEGCTVASSSRFVGANGIAISNDQQTIFVNDPPQRTIHVMSRESSGELTEVSSFTTTHTLDNIEMDADGRLSGGSIPLIYTCNTVCEDSEALSRSALVDGHEVGCGKSPGGLTSIGLLGTGGRSYVLGTESDIVMHDGSVMSGISSALQLQNRVIMGSPYSPGILLCDVPPTE